MLICKQSIGALNYPSNFLCNYNRFSMSTNLLGDQIVNDAMKTAGLNIEKESEQEINIIKSTNFPRKPAAGEIPNEDKENLDDESQKTGKFLNKLRRQTTKALRFFLEKENVEENSEKEEFSEEESNEKNGARNSIRKKMTKEIEIYEKEDQKESIDESENDSQSSELSQTKIKEMQKQKKKIDLNLLKSKRKTISMRLAFLSPSKIFFNFMKIEFYLFFYRKNSNYQKNRKKL